MIKPNLSQKNCLSEKLSHSDIRETNNSKILPKDDAQRLYIKQYIRSSIEYLFMSLLDGKSQKECSCMALPNLIMNNWLKLLLQNVI